MTIGFLSYNLMSVVQILIYSVESGSACKVSLISISYTYSSIMLVYEAFKGNTPLFFK